MIMCVGYVHFVDDDLWQVDKHFVHCYRQNLKFNTTLKFFKYIQYHIIVKEVIVKKVVRRLKAK